MDSEIVLEPSCDIKSSVNLKTWKVKCLLLCMVACAIVGMSFLTSRDEKLPKHLRYLSTAIGWGYFFAWSLSFYPQVLLNHRRRSTIGLSPDFQIINVLGFTAYSIYNASLMYWPVVRSEYYRRSHSEELLVQMNDLVFSFHACILTFITILQIAYFDWRHGRQLPHNSVIVFIILVLLTICIYTWIIHRSAEQNRYEAPWTWFDLVQLLGYLKLIITAIKYLPQAWANYRHQSTDGWSIGNILLDFTGGSLSLVQLLMDCSATGEWSAIMHTPAKFGLSILSMSYDILFMVQHYILYTTPFPRNRVKIAIPLTEEILASIQRLMDDHKVEEEEDT